MGDYPEAALRQAQGERKEGYEREKDALRLSPSKPPLPINPARGEAAIYIGGTPLRLRPSFAALVAAEAELGALFGLVERAAAGGLSLGEMAGLFWHCLDPVPVMTRETFSEALVAGGLVAATPALKALLTQILAGR